MLQYTLRRVVHTIPVLLGVLIVTFILLYIAPGDPVLAMVGDGSIRRRSIASGPSSISTNRSGVSSTIMSPV
jgi:ABC-type dipeptide/oligopeptide/nickel transport system permease component